MTNPRKRILVVEDDQDVNTLICRYLGHRGFECTGAYSASQCFNALDDGASLDLILIDLELPDLCGDELCRRIRAGGCELPLLLMTGYQSFDHMACVRDAGADGLLLKPFSPKELLARVVELTTGRAPTAKAI
jgi:DNA-binding response OmpR family regulator